MQTTKRKIRSKSSDFLLEGKSVLARILARENLNVIHDGSLKTASFDLKARTVYLPILKEMRGYVYDAFIAHEIAHALYTPTKEFLSIQNKEKIPHIILNIVEDARIERLVKERYPGTKQDFFQFYKEMASPERDFFDIHNSPITIDQRSFIDRANLYFKIGFCFPINFKNQIEKNLISKMNETKTFEDVVAVSKEIMEYMKDYENANFDDMTIKIVVITNDKNQSENENKEKIEIDENTIIIDLSDEEKELSDKEKEDEKSSGKNKKNDDNEESDNVDDSLNEQNNSEEKTESSDNKKENEDQSSDKNESKNDEGTSKITIEIGTTQNKFQEKFEKTLIDTNIYSKFGDVINLSTAYKNFIEKQNWILTLSSQIPTDIQSSAYNQFLISVKPTINMMVNQFNMKKSAKEYQKTKISNSGELDMASIAKYKTSKNLFKRNEEIEQSKNHGMIFIIDWSSSMGDNIRSTMMQLIVLMEFCKKLSIPFDVYGFTDSNYNYNSISVPKNKVFSSNSTGILFELFSSDMSNEVFRKSAAAIYSLISKNRPDMIHRMGNTPMNCAGFIVDYVVQDFRKKYINLEKVNLILLSDGSPTDGLQVGGETSSRVVMRNSRTLKNYECSSETNFHRIFKYVKDNNNLASLIGIYVTKNINLNMIRVLCPEPEKSNFNAINHVNEFSNKKYTVLPKNKEGFDQFYIISMNNFLLDEKKKDDPEINEYMSDRAIESAIHDMLSWKKNNMIFMKLFIDRIS